MSISINQEYSNLVPEITPEEYEALKQSVKENGLYVPLIVNQNGVLLDGHHRYKVCQELGTSPSHIVREFKDELNEKLFVIDCNLTRRQLNNFQRSELALKSKPILEAIAKRNESQGGKGDRNLTPLGRVDEAIGERAGVSRDTIRKVEKIIEFFSESQDKQVLDNLRTGKISVNEAYQQISIQEPIPSETKVPTEQEQNEDQGGDITRSPISIELERKHDDSVDDQYHNMKKLIELLSGVDYLEERDSNLALVAKTKEHRFKIVKQLSDLDVKTIYTYGRSLAHILNDYLKLLDDELDVRKAKEKLVSE